MRHVCIDSRNNIVDRRLHERLRTRFTWYPANEHVNPQWVAQIHKINSKTHHWFVETCPLFPRPPVYFFY